MRREKGITLISLVVTIIILLILAAITLNIVLGENGIISKTQEGKIGTEISREKEILQMSLSGIQASHEGNLTFDETELLNELKGYTENVEVTKSGSSMYMVKYTDTNREYEVYSNGKIDNATEKAIDENPGEFEGEGTEESPYLVQSIEDLVALSNNVNAGESYEGKYFNIENNLNFASRNSYVNPDRTDYGDVNGNGTTETLITELTTEAGFTPIGTSENNFKGNLDGKNYSIKNLLINKSGTGAFIGNATSNYIKNIILEDINITANSYTAGILAKYEGKDLTIDNCKVSGNIIANSDTGSILGYMDGNEEANITIKNCENNAIITGTGSSDIGGIIGRIWDGNIITIENCINNGNINSKGGIAGILGVVHYTNKLIVKNSTNNAELTSTRNAGGIIRAGVNNKIEISIENCNNYGNINGKGSYIAGIITELYGVNNVEIKRCNNYAEINTTSSCYIGGITGRVEGICEIYECSNEGNIIGDSYVRRNSRRKRRIILKGSNNCQLL